MAPSRSVPQLRAIVQLIDTELRYRFARSDMTPRSPARSNGCNPLVGGARLLPADRNANAPAVYLAIKLYHVASIEDRGLLLRQQYGARG